MYQNARRRMVIDDIVTISDDGGGSGEKKPKNELHENKSKRSFSSHTHAHT